MPDEKRQRILLVTRNLPPLVGGMERLNWHLAEQLTKCAEIRIIGPAGSAAHAPADARVREAPLEPLWKFLLRARMLARREARAWRPDIVLAGSGLTAPIAHSAARLCGAKSCVYVHGLDVAVRHPAYRVIWRPALRRMDRVIANSRPTRQLAQAIGIDPERIGIVHPGVELPSALPDTAAVARFRAAHQLGERPLLLSVGRLSTRKGLREFVSHALPRITARHPDVILLIVGDAPNDALHAQAQTPGSIRAAAQQAGVADNLRFLGRIDDKALQLTYCAANVHVFPVRKLPGDPEGFGMVAVEAAAHGLPTVAFATGGIIDAVEEDISGRLVEPGNYLAFADAILAVLANPGALCASSANFARRFAWPEFGTDLARQLNIREDCPSNSSSLHSDAEPQASPKLLR